MAQKFNGFVTEPSRESYDVVIIGGAMMGSSLAWSLTRNPSFDGSILVVERDPSYQFSSTAHTNSCMRQQFSSELNIKISQFAADFVNNFRRYIDDPRAPELTIQNFGYLYLADTPEFAQTLRRDHATQVAAGAGTELFSREDLLARFPFYQLDDISLGSLNTRDEGYWDGGAVFDWWRRKAIDGGAEYLHSEVTRIYRSGNRVSAIELSNSRRISCGILVNAAGPRAGDVSELAGLSLPVEPRKRYTWVVSAQHPLACELPLTIDPSGVHMRQDGPQTYMIGSKGHEDPAVQPDDFAFDFGLWENHVWPIVANRIPQFESLKVVTQWTGHYAFNSVDQNAVIGPHSDVENFLFMNGFSGHGLQQSPAMGRGLSELIAFGEYRSLDLSAFAYERLRDGGGAAERAVI